MPNNIMQFGTEVIVAYLYKEFKINPIAIRSNKNETPRLWPLLTVAWNRNFYVGNVSE